MFNCGLGGPAEEGCSGDDSALLVLLLFPVSPLALLTLSGYKNSGHYSSSNRQPFMIYMCCCMRLTFPYLLLLLFLHKYWKPNQPTNYIAKISP
nr:uncharacterized protein CTRU02_04868 [Colletotrichum truncatum]KAF6795306.1 hypothetical protein CTRU02_04868 [Colletotrichum truncatum]